MVLDLEAFPPAFRPLRIVGQGASGVVYEALRVSDGHRVAVKLLHGERSDERRTRERFEREVEILARLDHPAIVPVLAAEVEGARPWLAMPFIEGWSLTELTRRRSGGDERFGRMVRGELARVAPAAEERGATPWEQWVVEIGISVAGALAAAHDAGIVHRDLKPENVRLDPLGRPHLLDFGLARVNTAPSLTRTGEMLGTPLYMAPEQFEPGHEAGAAADLYALGLLLAELLAGRPVHEGDSLPELYGSVRRVDAPRVDRMREDLTNEVGRVLAACMRRDPNLRFSSARALRAALCDVRDGAEPVIPRRPTFSGMRRRLLGAVAGSLLLLLATVFVIRGLTADPGGGATSPLDLEAAGALQGLAARAIEAPFDEAATRALSAAVVRLQEAIEVDRKALRLAAAAGRLALLEKLEARASWHTDRQRLAGPAGRDLESLVAALGPERPVEERREALQRLVLEREADDWTERERIAVLRAVFARERDPAVLVGALEVAARLQALELIEAARLHLDAALGQQDAALALAALQLVARSEVPDDQERLRRAVSQAGPIGRGTLTILAGLAGGEGATRASEILLGLLLEALDTTSPDASPALLTALQRVPAEFANAMPRRAAVATYLQRLVEEGEPAVRDPAARLLGRWKLSQGGGLFRLLTEVELNDSLRAAILPAVGAVGGGASTFLANFLRKETPESLRAAAAASLARGGSDALPRLLAGLEDETAASVWAQALLSVDRGRKEDILRLARQAVRTADTARVRTVAFVSLGLARVGDDELHALIERTATRAGGADERTAAAWALARSRPDLATAELLARQLRGELQLAANRRLAGESIERAGRWVRNTLGAERAGEALEWIALWPVSPREPVEILVLAHQEVVANGEPDARSRAIQGLLDLARETVAPPRFRAAAIAALGRAGEAARAAGPELLGLRALDGPVERELVLALDRLGIPERADARLDRYSDPNRPVPGEEAFLLTVLALRRADPDRAREFLRLAQEHRTFDQRRIALEPELRAWTAVRALVRRLTDGI